MATFLNEAGEQKTVYSERDGIYYDNKGNRLFKKPDITTNAENKINTITSESLTPTSTTNFETPSETPVFPVASLTTPELQLTGSEQQAQAQTTRLQELNKQLLGESALRAKEEEKQGLPSLIKTQQDLSNQLKLIQAEQQQIPLQLQQESIGRGITSAGLAPLETARLRTNAIQALGTSALLQASQGNITTAQTLVDRAVAQEFDPIKAEIDATTKNLNLILQSPQYSLDEKNRAQKQLDIQEAKKKQVELDEANKTGIFSIATEAAKLGADAVTLKAIQEAKTKEEALQIATNAGIYNIPEELKTTIIESGGKQLLINSQTGETIKDLGTSGDIVENLIKQYPDSGILPTDDVATAQNKLQNSKIYRKEVKISGGASTGGGVVITPSEPILSLEDFADKYMEENQVSIDPKELLTQYNDYKNKLSVEQSSEVDSWLDLLNKGQATISNVPQSVRNEVVKRIGQTGTEINKQLSDTAISKITELQSGLSSLDALENVITNNMEYIGPISGWQQLNPWSKAKQVQSEVDRVRQVVGKALEGGVLRKEDEEKYKKILATLTDTPETALYKIQSIKSQIEGNIADYTLAQKNAGRYISDNVSDTLSPEEARSKYNY